MIIEYTVTDRLPPPARNVLSVVMAALKIKRAQAEVLIHGGRVHLEGAPLTRGHTKLRVGDKVEIDRSPEPAAKAVLQAPLRTPFEVLFHDDHLIVVNKPAGLLTVPTPSREGSTLLAQIQKWLQGQRRGSEAICVHRLDKLVSGVLVFAKSHSIADLLRDQFAARKPERLYRAFVRSTPDPPSGAIKSYLATDDDLNRRSSDDPEKGELAITHYQVEESWQDVSLLAVRLETGRRHQIRVHLSDLGHPILGDARYSPAAADERWPFIRIALHGETLGFTHPVTREALRFTAPWPNEFRQLRRLLSRKKS